MKTNYTHQSSNSLQQLPSPSIYTQTLDIEKKAAEIIPSSISMPAHVYTHFDLLVRKEYIPHEKRVMITPQQVANLTKNGYKIALEDWPERIFNNEEYNKAVSADGMHENFHIIPQNTWMNDALFESSVILGTKQIKNAHEFSHDFSLAHTYLHFDHSYKRQTQAEKRLARFAVAPFMGNDATLLDHEYCTDMNAVCTHSFSVSAGFSTAAISILLWSQKMHGISLHLPQFNYENKDDFFNMLAPLFKEAVLINRGALPKILILGSNRGRSANGAMKFIDELKTYSHLNIDYIIWNRQKTSQQQTTEHGLVGINDFDIILNTTFTDEACPAFINDHTVAQRNKTQIIGDITCDTSIDKNRIRVSNYQPTDFDTPAIDITENVALVSIDHSPSFFPKAASIQMAQSFFPHLQSLLYCKKQQTPLADVMPWNNALAAFEKNIKFPRAMYQLGQIICKMEVDAKDKDKNAAITITSSNIKDILEKHKDRIVAYIQQQVPNDEEKRVFGYYLCLGLLNIAKFTHHNNDNAQELSDKDLKQQQQKQLADIQAAIYAAIHI